MSTDSDAQAPDCPHCDGSGLVRLVTSHLGPDDYEYDEQCVACHGTGSAILKDAINALSYQRHTVTPAVEMVSRAQVLAILAARAEPDTIERLTQERAWRPIETAPKDGRVLLWGKYWNDKDTFQHPLIGIWNRQEDRWCVVGEFRFGVRPTHWMPLPAPPSDPTTA